MSAFEIALLLFFPGLMAFAAASDLFTMMIPNRVSLLLLAGFLAFAVLAGLPLERIGWHVAAGALTLAISFAFFAAGWMGGGDAKLCAATAVWCGWSSLLEYALLASALGGVLTLGLLLMRSHPLPHLAAAQPWLLRLHGRETGIPYGIALAAAGLLVYPQTPIWLLALGA